MNFNPIKIFFFVSLFLISSNFEAQTVKVFILAGQSNMQGQGDVLSPNLAGTLSHFMDNGGDEEFDNIRDINGNWATRDDVWLRFDNENSETLSGNLAVGYGGNDNQIGPELGFGHILGENSNDQILIIKTCWGGKNLAVDFRPPSSGGLVGPFYNTMISDINNAILNVGSEFPEYAGQEIEIAGFCWFQGWNDGEEESFLNEYEQNLINLISDVRTDLNRPDLPFVIGLTGNGGFEIDESDSWVQSLQTIIVPAQINAAQFAGHTNVSIAETRDFWRAADQSPEPDFVHHWRNNAESYLRIGTEMGLQMLDLLGLSSTSGIVPASGYGFNYFNREFVPDNSFGAGYSFYAAVWPLLQQYPGFENFQSGMGTWVSPQEPDNNPDDFYNTIEGGLGWWSDTRFGTAIPKFIMGGVAHSFDAAANGPGTGSGDHRPDGHRDWDSPGGKYGIAQLSPNLLWPPDGLNMEDGSNGQFLGYGYHPLPFTDPMEETNGVDFATGNQCWTLFMNSTNFKGPVAFFIPTFWAATILNDPSYEGLFLDTKPSDPNLAFAQEYSSSPALIGTDDLGEIYARIIPPSYPKTSANTSELLRDVRVYSKNAKWNEVENWFNGGAVPSTALQSNGTIEVNFEIDPVPVNAAMYSMEGPIIDAFINQEEYSQVKMSPDNKVGIFEWDTNVVTELEDGFEMPEFYKLNLNNEWDGLAMSDVPASSGLLDNEPEITPRNEELPYITPLEPDCHLFGTVNPWTSPGPSAGPFTVSIGDGSELTYYWFRFIDQPAVIHANLPEEMRQNLQERVEKIHTNWSITDEYIANPTGGNLVSLDQGLIVSPPAGLEIGYVPIVTRQQKIETVELTISVILEGAFDENTNLMRTTLANENLLPLNQPYSVAPYNYMGNEFINGASIPAAIGMVDWVLVEARVGTTNASKVDIKAGLLLNNGDIVGTDGLSPLRFELPTNSDVHFVVRHRNHLDVMTANSMPRDTNMNYDFTTMPDKAFGLSQQNILFNGQAAMIPADINQDHVIQVTDYDDWKSSPAILDVYDLRDLNLDGTVQVTDYDLWSQNKAKLGPPELDY